MKKILKIEGMHCGGCATGLEILLNAKGAKAKVDFDLKKAEIEFDPKKLSLKKIKEEIEEMSEAIELENYKLKSKYYQLGLRAKLRSITKTIKESKIIRDQKIEKIANNRDTVDILREHITHGVEVKKNDWIKNIEGSFTI